MITNLDTYEQTSESSYNNVVPFDPNKPILVDPSEYDFILADYWKGYLYGKVPKLILTFRIATEGPFYGYNLIRCYNIKSLSKRNEIIPSGWHSNLVRDYSKLFGTPNKLRDIGVNKFKKKVILGTVRTVEKNSRQRLLPDHMKYSVIDELLEVRAG